MSLLDIIGHDGFGESANASWSDGLTAQLKAIPFVENINWFTWDSDSYPTAINDESGVNAAIALAGTPNALALIGYSFGGAMACHLCDILDATRPTIAIAQLILIDAVPWGVGNVAPPINSDFDWVLPANVKQALSIQRSGPSMMFYPWSRPIKSCDGGPFTNLTVEASHTGIVTHPDVMARIVAVIQSQGTSALAGLAPKGKP